MVGWTTSFTQDKLVRSAVEQPLSARDLAGMKTIHQALHATNAE
jgi:hypothetical protein